VGGWLGSHGCIAWRHTHTGMHRHLNALRNQPSRLPIFHGLGESAVCSIASSLGTGHRARRWSLSPKNLFDRGNQVHARARVLALSDHGSKFFP
jgi:hypothetical protein